VLRPLFDRATEYGHYYMGKAAEYASRRMFVRNLGAGDATRDNFEASLVSDDPIFCYLLGHGNADTYSAQNQEIVMRTCNGNESLIGRIVLLLSCSCGIRLGPDTVNKGALTVFCWAVDFTWVATEDPPFDNYARGFFEAVNAISNALVEGRITGEAMSRSMSTWERWIDYWLASDDPYASMVVQHMIHDRDGQRLFGDETVSVVAPGAPPEIITPEGIPLPLPLLTGQTLLLFSLLL